MKLTFTGQLESVKEQFPFCIINSLYRFIPRLIASCLINAFFLVNLKIMRYFICMAHFSFHFQTIVFLLLYPVFVTELMFDVKFFITGDKLKVNESSLIMMNHRTTIDWLFFWEVFWQQSSVKSEKIILKRSLKWVPGFGKSDL